MSLFNRIILSMLLLTLGANGYALAASDKAKEKRWADQIVDALVIGEPVWLEAGSDRFLGIYSEYTTDTAKGGVVVIHGIGVHPDWPDIINPLRSELPDAGWTTLSIQMPVLENDASYEDYAPLMQEVGPRINKAIEYLRSKNLNHIAIVAHSMGTTMAASYLASGSVGVNLVNGFVAIGMSARDNAPKELDNMAFLQKIKTPMLDLYGSRDLESVTDSAAARKQAVRKAGNPDYRQDEVPGANHFFQGLSPDLVRRVRSWLDGHAMGQNAQ
jgi:pimeloyl-ACP methyl ester carboxylesterase